MAEPQTPNSPTLEQIDARLRRIESMLGRFESLASQLPGFAALAGDVADEWARHDGHADERVHAASALLERATRPDALRALQALVTQLELAPGLIAMLGDVVDELARHAEREGADLDSAATNLFEMAIDLARAAGRPETRNFVREVALSQDGIAAMASATHALSQARRNSTTSLGLFGAVGRMRDPDVQRAVGFLLDAAKTFGQELNATPTDSSQRLLASRNP